MLNEWLSLLRIVVAYKIYIEFVTWKFHQKLPLILFYLVHWHQHHISSLWLMPGLYNYWWGIASLEYNIGKKEMRMFYVASIIAFSIFLELLCKYALLVCDKFNIFRPPRIEPFGYAYTVFCRLRQVHTMI